MNKAERDALKEARRWLQKAHDIQVAQSINARKHGRHQTARIASKRSQSTLIIMGQIYANLFPVKPFDPEVAKLIGTAAGKGFAEELSRYTSANELTNIQKMQEK